MLRERSARKNLAEYLAILVKFLELRPRLQILCQKSFKKFRFQQKREFILSRSNAGGGIRTHAGKAQQLSRLSPYHSATPA